MGLESYVDHACAFRPDGSIDGLVRMLRNHEIAALMDRHDLTSMPVRGRIDGRPVDRVVHRSDLQVDVLTLQDLPSACASCPAGVLTGINGTTPGCRARISYPIDDYAVELVRDAMQRNAAQAETDDDIALVRSLVSAGECDGQRMHALIRGLEADPSPTGHVPVDFTIAGRTVPVTAYMLLEHICFRTSLDRAGQAALLRWFRYLYQAIGDRMAAAGGSAEEMAVAVYGRSPSLIGLNALRKVVERAHAQGRGMTFDG